MSSCDLHASSSVTLPVSKLWSAADAKSTSGVTWMSMNRALLGICMRLRGCTDCVRPHGVEDDRSVPPVVKCSADHAFLNLLLRGS
jgi:hypothetical protein